MTRWAADPRVSSPMLRKALDAAIEDYKATRPISDQLKVEYLGFLNTYNDPDLVWRCLSDPDVGASGKSDWLSRDVRLFSLAKTFKKEPERSRRVIRLVYANLLAVCDLPPDRRPPVACSVPNLTSLPGPPTSMVDLYQLDGTAPPSARALPPDQVLRWYRTTLYASRCSPALLMIIKAVDTERITQANLVIAPLAQSPSHAARFMSSSMASPRRRPRSWSGGLSEGPPRWPTSRSAEAHPTRGPSLDDRARDAPEKTTLPGPGGGGPGRLDGPHHLVDDDPRRACPTWATRSTSPPSSGRSPTRRTPLRLSTSRPPRFCPRRFHPKAT